MYYSYYFDVEKTHRINFGFKALLTNEEESSGNINAQFNVYIREVLSNKIIKEESQNVQFLFEGSKRKDDSSDYDVDFLRERISASSKFVFKVLNNRNNAQNVVIGLITDTAKLNPLGCEIIYENEPYKADIKAGNLSKIETQYVEPLIRQTVASYAFNEGGLPEEITLADGGEYVSNYKLYRATRFETTLKEAIKGANKFVFEANIAPEQFDPLDEPEVFDVTLYGIGTFTLNQTTISFMPDGEMLDEKVTVPLVQPLSAELFFNSGLRSNSLLRVTGDGKGVLKVTYAGVEINTIYNKENKFKAISIEGKIRKDRLSRVMLKLDNVVAYYEK